MSVISIKTKYDFFIICNAFVDRLIREANPSFVKIYLYIARHANDQVDLSLDKIADDTNMLKSDIISSFTYWSQMGALQYEKKGDSYSIVLTQNFPEQQKQKKESEEPIKAEKTLANPHISDASAAASYSAVSVVKLVNDNKQLKHLFSLIQQMLNKSLSQNDYKIIYSFIDYLKLPEQVIFILFEYCVTNGKTNMRYIEKVAYSWFDNGITTREAAEKYVQDKNTQQQLAAKYKQIFKITGRDFTDSETAMLLSWVNECKASDTMIKEAFETTVLNTGKVSFKYMDAIIKSESSNAGLKSSNVVNSKFRNYPEKFDVSDEEKKLIHKMMTGIKGGDNRANEQ